MSGLHTDPAGHEHSSIPATYSLHSSSKNIESFDDRFSQFRHSWCLHCEVRWDMTLDLEVKEPPEATRNERMEIGRIRISLFDQNSRRQLYPYPPHSR